MNRQAGRSGTCCRAFLLLLPAIAGPACGNKHAGGLTPQQRAAAMDAALDKFRALPGQDRGADSQELARFLQSRPEFEAAGLSPDGTDWSRFTDGRLYFIFNNRDLSGPPTPSRPAAPLHDRWLELPSTPQARVLNSISNCYAGDQVPRVAAALRAGGYAVETAQPTVDVLKAVAGDSVLYLQAHGGTGMYHDQSEAIGLLTSTPVDVQNETRLMADIEAGRIAYGAAKQDKGQGCEKDTYFVITDKFVRTYWQFARNSFVFLDSCSSDASTLKQAALDKGASLYAGWTQSAGYSGGAVRFLFERLLGTPKGFEPEDPPQRPFDHGPVLSDMHSRGLDRSGAATLVLTRGAPGDFGLLAPSIAFIDVDEVQGKLTLHGLFGTRQGKVTVSGNEALAIGSWTQDTIVTGLPSAGGDVVAEVDGHKSNAVQLTDWKGVLRYTFLVAGVLREEITWEVHLRADVHSYRTRPHEAPQDRRVPFVAASDTRCSYANSGTLTSGDGSVTWSGAGEIPLVPEAGTAGDKHCYVGGTIDPKQRAVEALVFAVHMTGKAITVDPPGRTIPSAVLSNPIVYDQPPSTLLLQLDEGFNVIGGARQTVVTESGVTGVVRIEWQTIPASSPPSADAAR